MSEQPVAHASGGGNVFTRKLGPMPMWAWMAIALVLAIVFAMMTKKKAASTATTDPTTDPNTPGGVDSSLVPQFVNQTYVNSTPPPAPPMSGGTTSTSQTVNAYSWTDTGQKWSATELAKELGISVGSLKASNALGKKALANPSAPIAKGAKFDYTKEPKGITTTTTVPNNTSPPKAT